jgi:hypothetical protein
MAATHSILSHNCILPIDTPGGTRQMWAERYILVSEGKCSGQDARRGWMLEGSESLVHEESRAGRNVETDVAIEDDW